MTSLFAQGKQISATVSQAFELAFRRFQEAKEEQQQFLGLKQKLEKAPPEEKEKIKKEIASLEAKKIAEEERLQRAREQIRSEAESRARSAQATERAPSTKSPPAMAPATAPATSKAHVPKPQPDPEPKLKKEGPVSQLY